MNYTKRILIPGLINISCLKKGNSLRLGLSVRVSVRVMIRVKGVNRDTNKKSTMVKEK